MGYDMIPEVMGLAQAECWIEKRRAIQHASAHIMISASSARDLEYLMPFVPAGSTFIAHCGVADPVHAVSDETINAFRCHYGLAKPYLLLVGERCGLNGYKKCKFAISVMQALVASQEAMPYTSFYDASPIEVALSEESLHGVRL